jgi:all-trans-8'-apo-beta-carotenal 15,15'-oxygenase
VTDLAPGLERIFDCDPAEGRCEPTVEGELPGALRGTCYLNGPALFRRGDLAYRHWLDGDGLVTALHFHAGRVEAVHRFVGSTKHREEEAAGKPLFRTFGTAFPGDRMGRGMGLEGPINVSAHAWAGTLLAFGEQSLPWELDPETLETRGEYRFGGRLNPVSPLSAHPAIDPATGEMWNFGISYAAREPVLHLYRFRGGLLEERYRVPIPYPCTVHDFGLSPTWAIFHLSPYLMDVKGLLAEGRSVVDSLSWEPERGAVLKIVRREGGEVAATLPLPGRYVLHLGNAFEEEGRLVVDLMELDRPVYDQYHVIPDLFTDVAPGRPVRLTIDTASWEIVNRREIAYDRTPDFPAWDPRRTGRRADDLWVLGMSKSGQPGRKFFDELAHLDWTTGHAAGIYRAPAGRYLGGEPAFLPDPDDPAAGWVICQEIDPAGPTTDFVLFDAFAVERGPIARIRLPRAIPPAFHASFVAR